MADRSPFPLGSRVRHQLSNHVACVIGKPDCLDGRIELLPVILERSTRWELWPVNLAHSLEPDLQPVGLGGTYEPPPGYPLKA